MQMAVRALLVLALSGAAVLHAAAITDCATITGGTVTAANCLNRDFCTQCSRAPTVDLQNNCYACVVYAIRTGNDPNPCVNAAQVTNGVAAKGIAATDCICRSFFFQRGGNTASTCISCAANPPNALAAQQCSCCVVSATGASGGSSCLNSNGAGTVSSCPVVLPPGLSFLTGAVICPQFFYRDDFNFNNDRYNCGKCMNQCADPLVCSGGKCVPCPTGKTFCGGSCVDTESDNHNCGGCGKVCDVGASCIKGACVCPAGTLCCPSGQSACDGKCINDDNNCGSCGYVCTGGSHCSRYGSCICRDPRSINVFRATGFQCSFPCSYTPQAGQQAGCGDQRAQCTTLAANSLYTLNPNGTPYSGFLTTYCGITKSGFSILFVAPPDHTNYDVKQCNTDDDCADNFLCSSCGSSQGFGSDTGYCALVATTDTCGDL